jgi:peptide/nickel transport system substrate-binding protein
MPRKSTIGRILSSAAALSVLVSACSSAPSVSTTTSAVSTPARTSAEPLSTVPRTSSQPTSGSAQAQAPKYGGSLTVFTGTDVLGFDEGNTIHFNAVTLKFTNEELLTGDWAKGPEGSGETSFTVMGNRLWSVKTGAIAESWESPEIGHMIFKIRHGIHYGLNSNSEASRLVNGRELNADDVVSSLKRYCTEPAAYIRMTYPAFSSTVKITAPDKWSVDVQSTADQFINVLTMFTDFATILPPEVIQKYGDMRDWHNSAGTGPFFLTDFVSNSSVTFKRNPNYWGKDPAGPGKGNQLPYVDSVKILVISDTSTRLAAMRAAKLDWGGTLTSDDAKTVMQTSPQMKYIKIPPESGNVIYMRTDKAPYSDIRVRQALMRATDYDSIVKSLFGGEAEINCFPITPIPGYMDAYLPLSEAPDSAKQLYEYNPQAAKDLLTQAGYPNGFKATIICDSASTTAVDYLSIMKGMWSKVGVDLSIEQREHAAFSALYASRKQEDMIYALDASTGVYVKMVNFTGVSQQNGSHVNDPTANKALVQVLDAYCKLDEATVNKVHKDLMKHVLAQAWAVPFPLPPSYLFWWPWLKGYQGELSPGDNNMLMWPKYVWVDQALREQMVGRR